MSDPVTNVEIEDILSSIRRLVSEDAPARAPQPKPARSDRLVLTPALRVQEPLVDDVPEPQAANPEPILLTNPVPEEVPAIPEAPQPQDGPSLLARLVQEEVSRAFVPVRRTVRRADPPAPKEPHALEVSEVSEGEAAQERAGPLSLRDRESGDDSARPKDVLRLDELSKALVAELAAEAQAAKTPPAETASEPETEPAPETDIASLEAFRVQEPDEGAAQTGNAADAEEEDVAREDETPETAAEDAVDASEIGLENLQDVLDALSEDDPHDHDAAAELHETPPETEAIEADEPDDPETVDTLDLTAELAGETPDDGMMFRSDGPLEQKIAALEALIKGRAPTPLNPPEETSEDAQDLSAEELHTDDPSFDEAATETPADAEALTQDAFDAWDADIASSDLAASTAANDVTSQDEPEVEDAAAVPEALVLSIVQNEPEPEAEADAVEDDLSRPPLFQHQPVEDALEWEDHADAQAARDWTTPDVIEAAPVVETPETHDSADLSDERGQQEGLVLDEAALHELVSDIVRQELQGVLGERITRNVRKLVRREIHRVMMTQDFD